MRELPTGVGGPGAPLLTNVGGSTRPARYPRTSASWAASPSRKPTSPCWAPASTSAGPALPLFEPTLIGKLDWSHQSNPQSTLSSYGVNPVVLSSLAGTFGVQKGFATGTSVSAGYSSHRQSANWIRPDYNPFTTSTAGVTVTQRLMQGFRLGG